MNRLPALLLAASALSSAVSAQALTPINLITNGDFALSHRGTTLSGNPAIPDAWFGIQTQTANARVLDGAMMFSTAHPSTNVNLTRTTSIRALWRPATGSTR